ncbi:hydroxypyruvate isomerase family protein [Aquimarina sp. 2201CG14-23]|uniref:hydroxypyruvate isomerase family protein n=1 Tax=Aquimarina mycalae TaxID=3040073 RepID=UPI002477FA12|nr:TIM barrel protein [Aquimarina sp. 2201CG14-23]MDH7448099.1 TIM barrel protein [Aquimarina sp. 2201CG14-23]
MSKIHRRKAIRNLSLGLGTIGFGGTLMAKSLSENPIDSIQNNLKGNINHSVCRWCYQNIPLDEFAEKVKEIGIKAIDLLKPDEWSSVQKYGLDCSLATDTFASITDGFNDPKNHVVLQEKYRKLISQASHSGIKQVIVFSGNRKGISDNEGLEHCAIGLDTLVRHAEKNNVTLVMELLNSKLDHKDYQCDHTPWGVGLVDKIGSTNFKLLYDIYHMQIMEGDIITTIDKYNDYIAHYHTGGVPGRNEINETQELNYAAIMKTIVKNGYKGYVAQEFIPSYTDKLKALTEGL